MWQVCGTFASLVLWKRKEGKKVKEREWERRFGSWAHICMSMLISDTRQKFNEWSETGNEFEESTEIPHFLSVMQTIFFLIFLSKYRLTLTKEIISVFFYLSFFADFWSSRWQPQIRNIMSVENLSKRFELTNY